MTYYPRVRHSERHRAGNPPERFSYSNATLSLETPAQDDYIPTSYSDALKKADAEDWVKAVIFKINFLKKLSTWSWCNFQVRGRP